MDPKNTNKPSGPNLSQYFANDPPSFFDGLSYTTEGKGDDLFSAVPSQSLTAETRQAVENYVKTNITSSTFTGAFKANEYVDMLFDAEDEESKISDDIRNTWVYPPRAAGQPPLLTMPGVHQPQNLPDTIGEAVVKHLGKAELEKRKILNVDNVTQDERGLRMLISAGCYRAAVNLTARLLNIYGQGYGRGGQPAKHSPHSLQLWFIRLALLAKLGEYELLQTEAEPFDQLNRHDLFYEFYPEMYKDKKGSIASFSFRLLLAELPVYLGKPQEALDLLSELYVQTATLKTNFFYSNARDAERFWHIREMRILHTIVNCGIVMKKWGLIEDILNETVLPSCQIAKEDRRALYSAWGRIYLQIGDIFGAEQKFAEARRLRDMSSPPDLRDLVDKGLITVSSNDFPEAFAIFQRALHLESGNTMILNNMGVCLLYAGKLKEAINLFERAISLNPQKSLNESLLVNLSTLYELESNLSKSKKLNLLRLINLYKPDLNISVEICLKLQSPN